VLKASQTQIGITITKTNIRTLENSDNHWKNQTTFSINAYVIQPSNCFLQYQKQQSREIEDQERAGCQEAI
jgi:hypothetical protein